VSPERRPEGELGSDSGNFALARVLVVEDDATVADVMLEVLADEPMEVMVATTAEEALRMIAEDCPDLILTDISLPGKSGLEVMRQARVVDPEVAVVLMTGHASVQNAIDALRQGASDYITKPFDDIGEIPKLVRRHLGNRRLKVENRALLSQLRRQNEVLQRHEQELRERVQQATVNLDTLYRVSMEIGANLELQPRLARIVETAARLVSARVAVLYLQSEDSDEFRRAAAHGVEAASAEDVAPHFHSGEGFLGRVARDQTPSRVGSPSEAAVALPGYREAFAHEVLAVPVVSERQCIGVLAVADRAEGFAEGDLEFLRMFAAQAAVHLRNSQLFEHTKVLDRLKSDFVAVVSHEIRTPLTSVKGAVELLSDGRYFKNSEQQTKLLSIAHANAERLLLLINDILDFSKLEAASLPMTLERQRLEPVVQLAAQNLRMLLEERRIRLEVALADDLPDAMLDAHRITQVVTNLLSNAIKFSPPGERVRVEASTAEGVLRVSVRDHGEGIAAKDLPKLFKKFQQIDSGSTRKVGGTGLGLVICKGIVEQHGGRIGVESVPGEGSQFWFTLPAADSISGTTPIPVMDPSVRRPPASNAGENREAA
jgi:signal transduction histidine kinase/ActR/RegA family two-component response regulator